MVIRWTIAGRAPATTSGTLVLTCATAASAPTVAARAGARTATPRTDMVSFDISRSLSCGRRVSETEGKMKRRSLLVLALSPGPMFPHAAAPTIAIDASSPAGKVSPLLYGLMTEEIQHGYDGGLSAAVLTNRCIIDH